ncbi:HAMP domain-containing sensor histidine kinase [Fodinicola feengrottensis]|uniref:histidine kinase n=1 Tax=Fodinicola feengrottensis TaxID=435914 RepID=A0ABN2HIL9_9ACTN
MLLSGLLLVGVTYVLFANALSRNLDTTLVSPRQGANLVGDVVRKTPASIPRQYEGSPPVDLTQLEKSLQAQRAAVEAATTRTLLQDSLVALGVVSVLAMGGGWLLAGRTLRPLQRITSTARMVAHSTLHERIALDGPPDELKELADTFDAMLARLDRSFGSQRRFVADASHELRTPLAVNRTLLEVAAARPGACADLRELSEKLLTATARHEKLLDGLLTLARGEEGLAAYAPVDLAETITHAVDLSRPEAEKAGVDLRLTAEPALASGDAVLLERVAQNLLQNAITYNNSGGWVTIHMGLSSGYAELTVTNTGPDVPADRVEEIFEPFRRLGPRTAGTGRVGLGLAIVRSVAVAHDGTVTATARPGGGLVVRFAIPAV